MDKDEYEKGEKLILNDSFAISNIYVDIGFLKYLDLGRFLSKGVGIKSIYDKVASFVYSDDFVKRSTNELKYLLPDLNIDTNTKISDDALLRISPSFDKVEEFILYYIELANTAKTHYGINNPTKLFLDVSCLPKLSNEMKDILVKEYSAVFGIDVALITDFKGTTINRCDYDAFFVSDLFYFNDVVINFLNSGELMGKYLFCQKLLIISKMNKKDPSLFESVFHNIEIAMTTAIKFKFIQPFPCFKGD